MPEGSAEQVRTDACCCIGIDRIDTGQTISITIAAETDASADLFGTPLDGTRMRGTSRSEAHQAGTDGIVIESTLPGSPAAQAGLRASDMFVAVNPSPVSSVADLRSAFAGQRTILALELIHDGGRLLLVVK